MDEDGSAYDELIARGFRTVPLTVVGDRTVAGYDPAALGAAIRQLRPDGPFSGETRGQS